MKSLQYPIGTFVFEGEFSLHQLKTWTQDIEQLPMKLREAVNGFSEDQLDTPYREGGWTLRQVVHHLADSHMNSFIRFKLALTEVNPTIKPYDEQLWAELVDSKSDAHVSVALIEALHTKWVFLLKSMSTEDFERTFYHPGYNQTMSLAYALGLYAWHGQHHVAHITGLRDRLGI
jgi:uncharacterized damage-inducible protein DinB